MNESHHSDCRKLPIVFAEYGVRLESLRKSSSTRDLSSSTETKRMSSSEVVDSIKKFIETAEKPSNPIKGERTSVPVSGHLDEYHMWDPEGGRVSVQDDAWYRSCVKKSYAEPGIVGELLGSGGDSEKSHFASFPCSKGEHYKVIKSKLMGQGTYAKVEAAELISLDKDCDVSKKWVESFKKKKAQCESWRSINKSKIKEAIDGCRKPKTFEDKEILDDSLLGVKRNRDQTSRAFSEEGIWPVLVHIQNTISECPCTRDLFLAPDVDPTPAVRGLLHRYVSRKLARDVYQEWKKATGRGEPSSLPQKSPLTTHGSTSTELPWLKSPKVALKQFKEIESTNRKGLPFFLLLEIEFALQVSHPNIIKGLEVVLLPSEDTSSDVSSNTKFSDVTLVLEYCSWNLLDFRNNSALTVNNESFYFFYLRKVACLLYQTLQGIKFFHTHGILHRDIKPSNILVSSESGLVKLADLGLTTYFTPSHLMEMCVVSPDYRSPELLFGKKDYSEGIDIFSLGCTFAEMFLDKALILHVSNLKKQRMVNLRESVRVEKDGEEGKNAVQLWQLTDILGPIKPDLLPKYATYGDPEMSSNVTLMQRKLEELNLSIESDRIYRLREVFRESPCKLAKALSLDGLPENAEHREMAEATLDLLGEMLLYDPSERISAAKALEHPLFSGKFPVASRLDIVSSTSSD